jgi:fructokinase
MPMCKPEIQGITGLVASILNVPRRGQRRVVAIVGPPGSGKSTIAEALVPLIAQAGGLAQVVPMDGFHLDNSILLERNLINVKGSPGTFDVGGFVKLISRLSNEAEIIFPKFDRNKDLAIAGADFVSQDCDLVLVEGNYLLLDAPFWRDLSKYWDFSVFLDVETKLLRERLMQRWLDQGLSLDQAKKRVEDNDLVNVETVVSGSSVADLTFVNSSLSKV